MNKLLITLTTILMLTGLASMPAAKAEEGLYVNSRLEQSFSILDT